MGQRITSCRRDSWSCHGSLSSPNSLPCCDRPSALWAAWHFGWWPFFVLGQGLAKYIHSCRFLWFKRTPSRLSVSQYFIISQLLLRETVGPLRRLCNLTFQIQMVALCGRGIPQPTESSFLGTLPGNILGYLRIKV